MRKWLKINSGLLLLCVVSLFLSYTLSLSVSSEYLVPINRFKTSGVLLIALRKYWHTPAAVCSMLLLLSRSLSPSYTPRRGCCCQEECHWNDAIWVTSKILAWWVCVYMSTCLNVCESAGIFFGLCVCVKCILKYRANIGVRMSVLWMSSSPVGH